MTTDPWGPGAIDLVIFTVADPRYFGSLLWDKSLVSFGNSNPAEHEGLSLFVVTVPISPDLYKYPEDTRVLPGGFLQYTETLEKGAKRIALDKLGLNFDKLSANLKQLGTFDEPDRDHRGRTVSFAYWAIVNFEDIRRYLGGKDQVGLELVNSQRYMDEFEEKTGRLEDSDGVSRFGYRTMPSPSLISGHQKTLTAEMPSGKILGQDHDNMVFYAWRKLRHAFNIRMNPFAVLGLNPIGEEFRLSDLQELAEVCRGERIQRDFFRRNVMNFNLIQPSGNLDRSRPGKPAKMYKTSDPDDYKRFA